MPNQVAILTLDGDTDNGNIIVSHSMSFNSKTDMPVVFISVLHNFSDESPLFDWWFGAEKKSAEILITNMNVPEGEGSRNLKMENAVCTNYTESFNGTTPVSDDMCQPIVTITIEAETVTMGGTSFAV
jgi:hypothetical protein